MDGSARDDGILVAVSRADDGRQADDPRLDNEARYDEMAPSYERTLRRASLGSVGRLYRAVAEELRVGARPLVVELGCGPGLVTPYLRAALGDGARFHGIDVSGGMIEQARARAAREGWDDVVYEKADAHAWQPPAPADAVVMSLVLSTIPEPLRCLDRALSWLAPGGQIVLLDSFLLPGRWLVNRVVSAKARVVGAVPGDLPLEEVTRRLAGPRVTARLGGTYHLVSGRRP